MSVPKALIASCGALSPLEIIKQLYQADTIPGGTHLLETIYAYPWSIDNKYYTAEIQLCTTDCKTIGDAQFAEDVDAFIVYFDSRQVKSFSNAKGWLPFLDLLKPEIKLLVCDRSSTVEGVGRSKVLDWCIDNSFELIELDPEQDSDNEDDFETTGIKRMVQALHAHTWSNLQLRESPIIKSPFFSDTKYEQLENEQSQSDTDQKQSETDKKQSQTDQNESTTVDEAESDPKVNFDPDPGPSPSCCHSDSDQVDKTQDDANNKDNLKSQTSAIDNLLGVDVGQLNMMADKGEDCSEQEIETFERLFSQIKVMKEKADNLPNSERKHYAEQVAISFWKAMGGDDSEVTGLSDSD